MANHNSFSCVLKRASALMLALLTLLMLSGCYPLRVAKNPNPSDEPKEALATALPTEPGEEAGESKTPSEEPDLSAEPSEDPEITEEPSEQPILTEQAAQVPAGSDDPEVTSAPTQQATAAPTATPRPGETSAPTDKPTPTPAPTQAQSATDQPALTATPKPTATPTPKPTNTPKPTFTPKPTATPEPTVKPDFVFTTYDIGTNAKYTESIFSRKKLTMINFWATWCGPCIEELPYIQQVSEKYSLGLQVLTVLYDSSTPGSIESALRFANSAGLSVPILRCNDSVKAAFVAPYIQQGALPTTFFINRSGKLVKILTGSHDYDAWCSEIEKLL